MTWLRTLDIGDDSVSVRVTKDGYVEVVGVDCELLTPKDAVELADVLKRAARFATRERELATTRRRTA